MLILSCLTAVLNLVIGIYILIAWKNVPNCSPFAVTATNVDFSGDGRDWCTEGTFATVAFAAAGLYFIISLCLYTFLVRRYDDLMARRRAELEAQDGVQGVEMAVASPVAHRMSVASGGDVYPPQTAKAEFANGV